MKISLKTNKLSLIACLLIAGFIFLQSCEKTLEELTEGTLIEVDSDLLHTPVIVRFQDAKDRSTPNNITVELVGQDANQLFSTAGSATVKPTAGLMDIGFDKNIDVSPDNPFEFTIITKAIGYLTTYHTVILTDVQPHELVIEMVNILNLPDGVTITNHSFMANSNGTSIVSPLETDENNFDAPTVRIPLNTVFFDADGNALSGQASFQIVRFDPSVEGSSAYTPQSNWAKMANENVETGIFAPLATYDFIMVIGNKEVKTFSNPLILSTKIPAGATDENGQQIEAGFTVPFWSLNETTGEWQFENEKAIQSSGNQLTLSSQITHFSTWRPSPFFPTTLAANSFININSDIPNDSELEYKYHSELVFNFWGFKFRNNQWAARTQYFRSGQQINKPPTVWANLPYQLQVYDGPRGCARSILSETTPFRFASNPTVNLNSLFAIQPIIKLDFVANVLCDNITVKPTLYIMYKPSNLTCWRLLGVMVNGKINTNQLDLDTSYDFKSVWNDKEERLDGVVIRETAIAYGATQGLTESEVNAALANINNLDGTININVNDVNEPMANWLIRTYDIIPTQAECDDLTGN